MDCAVKVYFIFRKISDFKILVNIWRQYNLCQFLKFLLETSLMYSQCLNRDISLFMLPFRSGSLTVTIPLTAFANHRIKHDHQRMLDFDRYLLS